MGSGVASEGPGVAAETAGVPAPRSAEPSVHADSRDLLPYVPRLVVDWLAKTPAKQHRAIAGSGVFADISGFTALTERLAERGKAGAEEMGDLLNATFDSLLTAAYDYGANLVKWGGDAVLLLFEGDGHAIRAAQAAWEMQSVMRRVGRLKTSAGAVTLGMSIGVHSGEFDFMLVGSRYRELIVTGPAATTTAHMEKVAERGQIVVSSATRAAIPVGCAEAAAPDGWLLSAAPGAVANPNKSRRTPDVDLGVAFCSQLRDHLSGGVVDYEHRRAVIGFIEFSGTDDLLAAEGIEALTAAVDHVVALAQEAAAGSDVTVLSTDLCENGGKIILASGIPHSVGDAESRVLSAVRRVVRPGGRLSVRAGINVGRVFAGDYGPVYRRVYSITGDCVNLAARLMAHAEPGQIVAMPEVLDASRTQFETTPLPPFQVKGKTAPIEALAVGDPRRAAAAPSAARLPMVGREPELGVLLDGVASASRGIGQVIELVGGAGIGKSRLLEELAERTDVRVLWADGDVYATTTPYQPMRRLLRHTLGLAEEADDALLAAMLRDLTASSAPDLLAMLPLIGLVAGITYPETPEVAALDKEVRKTYLEGAVSDLLGRLLRTPLVMIVNDLYLMDEATIDLLKRLASDVADRPWLLIATRRPETSSPFGSDQPTTVLRVEPLGQDAAAELIAVSAGGVTIAPHHLRQLVERSGGNPLFLLEMVKGARSGADVAELPDSVEGVIAAHIDRLTTPRRRWLRAASVLGMTVDLDLLGSVLGTETPESGVDVAADMADFLVAGADGMWRFSHHLVRSAAYEGLPFRRRAELHAKTADLLEQRGSDRSESDADLLSMHCFHGERYDRAWHYSQIAARRARSQYAPAEAAECYRRALSSAARLGGIVSRGEVAQVCEELAVVYFDLGERAKSDQALADGRRRAKGDILLSASLWLRTAAHREQSGRYADALRWVTKARRLLAGRDEPAATRLLGQLAQIAAGARQRQGRFGEAITEANTALFLARRCGDRETEADAMTVRELAGATTGLPYDGAKLEECIAIYEELDNVRGLAYANNWFGACAYYAGRWDDAVTYYQRAERAYWRSGREFDAAANAANRAEVLIAQGRLGGVAEILNDAMAIWRSTDSTSAVSFGLLLLGQAALASGDVEQARVYLEQARAIRAELGEVNEVVTTDSLIAECHLRSGDFTMALRVADDALGRAGQGAPGTPVLLRVRGEALVALGRVEEGHAALCSSLAEARGRNARHEIAAALRVLLEIDGTAAPAERDAWRQERDELVSLLGLVEAQPAA
ncbi:MAG TPA: adenylate/guanylate cyclase domain-containing protein [Mycobacteriales bacterium]|nr:adenylate/guanylate cyclase domain-containing protein [Mycobacteriales bacterium]